MDGFRIEKVVFTVLPPLIDAAGVESDVFGFDDWRDDARLVGNGNRCEAREWMLPELERRITRLPLAISVPTPVKPSASNSGTSISRTLRTPSTLRVPEF